MGNIGLLVSGFLVCSVTFGAAPKLLPVNELTHGTLDCGRVIVGHQEFALSPEMIASIRLGQPTSVPSSYNFQSPIQDLIQELFLELSARSGFPTPNKSAEARLMMAFAEAWTNAIKVNGGLLPKESLAIANYGKLVTLRVHSPKSHWFYVEISDQSGKFFHPRVKHEAHAHRYITGVEGEEHENETSARRSQNACEHHVCRNGEGGYGVFIVENLPHYVDFLPLPERDGTRVVMGFDLTSYAAAAMLPLKLQIDRMRKQFEEDGLDPETIDALLEGLKEEEMK